MINKRLLRSKLAAVGMTQNDLADRLSISKNTMSSKINGKTKLYVCEAERICEILGVIDMEERANIFLHEESQ